MALYFATVWSSTIVFLISWSESIKRFKMAAIIRFDFDVSKMIRHCGCCTTVVVQNKIQIHQQKRGKAYFFAIISMQNEPNPFLCHPAVLGSSKFATCFLSHLFYSQFGIAKIRSIVFNSVSRHNDVIL